MYEKDCEIIGKKTYYLEIGVGGEKEVSISKELGKC